MDLPDIETPTWHRFRLGDVRVTTVLDGVRIADGPHPTFGADQSADAVAALMRENRLPERRFVNMFNPALLEIGGELVLFDTGMGPMGRANGSGQLTRRMAEAGYRPEDVTLVVLTHLHGDHIGGLMEEDGPAFRNARYVVGRTELGWWTSEEALTGQRAGNAQLVLKNVMPLQDRTVLVAEGDEILPGLIAHEAFGHSPGHMIFEIRSDERKLWMTADTANHFVASLQRPDWHVAFDMDKAGAVATRRRVFDRIAEEASPFIGYHMPFPAVGYVTRLGGGYRFVPESYQLQVEG
ncbi:MBL fold metallo-hydrolase [Consotaella sp. CSK11QG-6]